jgi:RNA polymerase-binding transcription factor DksA
LLLKSRPHVLHNHLPLRAKFSAARDIISGPRAISALEPRIREDFSSRPGHRHDRGQKPPNAAGKRVPSTNNQPAQRGPSTLYSQMLLLCRMALWSKGPSKPQNAKMRTADVETVIRYSAPRRTKMRAEIERLTRLVEDLQSKLAKFTYRCCIVCEKPFVAGRGDAITCSARCRIKLHRKQHAKR